MFQRGVELCLQMILWMIKKLRTEVVDFINNVCANDIKVYSIVRIN